LVGNPGRKRPVTKTWRSSDNNILFQTEAEDLSSETSRPSAKPAQYRVSFPPEYKRLGRDVNHLPSTTAGVKNEWIYTSTPPLCLQILDTEGINWIDLAQDNVVADFFFRTGSKASSSIW
jgi:hypothetical protein